MELAYNVAATNNKKSKSCGKRTLKLCEIDTGKEVVIKTHLDPKIRSDFSIYRVIHRVSDIFIPKTPEAITHHYTRSSFSLISSGNVYSSSTRLLKLVNLSEKNRKQKTRLR
jgi:hypothetical protein